MMDIGKDLQAAYDAGYAARDKEIVRCGECVHRFVEGENVWYNICELLHNRVQSDDWFCADGERKDGER